MRLAKRALLALAWLGSSGCLVLSVHPVYVGSTVEVDEHLLGTWESTETGVSVTIARGEWKAYRISYTDRAGTLALTGYEDRIGNARFLDVTPEHGLEQSLLLTPLHGVCRLTLEGDRLTASPLDYDWFVDAIDARRLKRLQFTIDERRNVVLTSEGAALRDWIRDHAASAEAFGPATILVRKRSG